MIRAWWSVTFVDVYKRQPQVEPGLDVVRAGDGDVRDFIPFHLLQHRRLGSGLRFPVVAEELIDTGNEAFRLVQAYVGITEELASDVCLLYTSYRSTLQWWLR